MNILVSFCNTIETPGYPNLGVIDLETKKFSVLDIDPSVSQTGMTGLAMTSKYILVGLQHAHGGTEGYNSPAVLLIFDRNDFTLINPHSLDLVRDIHSFLWVEEKSILYIVSSGTDEIIKLEIDDSLVLSEVIFWKPVNQTVRTDTIHINSIYRLNGEIFISGFGLREIEGEWKSAHDGFIYNISADKKIISGLEQPHSIDVIDGKMAFCESRAKTFRYVDDESRLVLPGYSRGLCHTDDKIFIGTSASRKKSKSTGKLNSASEQGSCTITQVERDSLMVEYIWNLDDYAVEIYELMLVEDVSGWPLIKPKNYREEFQQSWLYRSKMIFNDIHNYISTGETLLFVDDNLLYLKNEFLSEYNCLPFLERNGVSWGPPENDEIAVLELNRMIHDGAGFIVFGWSSFWWFDFYPLFYSHLHETGSCILKNENVVLFRLK